MTASIRITKRVVDALRPGDLIWDSDVKGFAVLCQTKARVYLLEARINGRQRWLTIGEHGAPWTAETARHEAQRLWGQIREGTNIVALREARRQQPTVSELCDRFLADYARFHKKASSTVTDHRNIENHIKPLIGQRTVAEITHADVDDLKRKIAAGRTARPAVPIEKGGNGGLPVTGGPGVANRTLAALSKMMSLAEEWGVPIHSWGMPIRCPSYRPSRPRVLRAIAGPSRSRTGCGNVVFCAQPLEAPEPRIAASLR